MKHFKKFFSYLVALTMVLSLAAFTGVKVHAQDTTYKLTLKGTATGHTYEAYQVFTGNLAEKGGKKVLSNVQWGTGVNYTQGTGENKSAADVAKDLGDGTMTIDTLISRLTLNKDKATTKESTAGNTEITGLAAGYYLVKDADNSQKDKSDAYTKFIVQVVGDTEADIKSGVPTVEKKVKDTNDSTGATSDWQDSADADINDTVEYQITGTMPANIDDYTSYKYVFTDTMSKGLTYTTGKATIKIGDTDVTGAFTENVDAEENGPTVVTWSCDNLKSIDGVTLNKDTKVVVTYTAKLNEHAVIGSAGNPNTVNLTYSNNPNNGGKGETGKTPDDKNIVFTYKVVVNKVDQDKKSLAGAAFKLEKKNSDGTYKTVKEFTAGTETSFEFKGLDDGDYKLVESTTPAGYNTMEDKYFTITAEHDILSSDPSLTELKVTGDLDSTITDKTATADKEAGTISADIENKPGSTLPSTGGMGTTLLYVAGGILVACAAAYVVMSRKHSTNK